MNGLFVTGTDTGVGKTLVSAALVLAYSQQGVRVAGLKPIVSGVVNGVWEDVEILRQLSHPQRSVSDCALYTLQSAIAPQWAAREEGVSLDAARIVDFVRAQALTVDRVVVEGAGGFLVPLTSHYGFAHLAQDLQLPVVLVVGLRLGAINHALLTCEAIRNRGLVLRGWVGSALAADIPDGTIEGLQEWLPAPCLGLIPYRASVDAAYALDYLDLAKVWCDH